MNPVIVTYLNITFEAEGTTEEIPLAEMTKQLNISLDSFIEDTTINGQLHYDARYSNGASQRVTLAKNEIHMTWGYVIENFLYTWRMIYEWLYKKEIYDGEPFKRYASLYEAFAEQLSPEDYVEFKTLSEEEITKIYGSPFEPRDEIALNEEQMKMYLDTDLINTRELIRQEGHYFDHVFEKWVKVEPSIEIFRQLYIDLQY